MADLRETLSRMVFLRKRMELLVEEIQAQGFRTEDQSNEAEMLVSMADEIQEEINLMTGGAIPETFTVTTEHVCRHCGKPVRRDAGMWLHVHKADFEVCRRAGIPRERAD